MTNNNLQEILCLVSSIQLFTRIPMWPSRMWGVRGSAVLDAGGGGEEAVDIAEAEGDPGPEPRPPVGQYR